MVSFILGFATIILLPLLIWLHGYRARRQFEDKLTNDQFAALRAHMSLGGNWRDFRQELRQARAHAKAERQALENKQATLRRLEREIAQEILRKDNGNMHGSVDREAAKNIPQSRDTAPPLQPST